MDIKTAIHNPDEDLYHVHAAEINAVNEMLVDDLNKEFAAGSPNKEHLHALFDRKVIGLVSSLIGATVPDLFPSVFLNVSQEKLHKHNLGEMREEEHLWREEFDRAINIMD